MLRLVTDVSWADSYIVFVLPLSTKVSSSNSFLLEMDTHRIQYLRHDKIIIIKSCTMWFFLKNRRETKQKKIWAKQKCIYHHNKHKFYGDIHTHKYVVNFRIYPVQIRARLQQNRKQCFDEELKWNLNWIYGKCMWF